MGTNGCLAHKKKIIHFTEKSVYSGNVINTDIFTN
jgi:hypothetical protein